MASPSGLCPGAGMKSGSGVRRGTRGQQVRADSQRRSAGRANLLGHRPVGFLLAPQVRPIRRRWNVLCRSSRPASPQSGSHERLSGRHAAAAWERSILGTNWLVPISDRLSMYANGMYMKPSAHAGHSDHRGGTALPRPRTSGTFRSASPSIPIMPPAVRPWPAANGCPTCRWRTTAAS